MRQDQKDAIRARAERAVADLYHNATLPYFPELYGRTEDYAQSWLEDTCRWEIAYLRDGGAYGKNYRKTLAADFNAGRYKSERARAYYIAKGMRAYAAEQNDCGMLTGWRVFELATGNEMLRRALAKHGALRRNDAMWERITEYGELYQYGRGGRTLAPANLWRSDGRGHGPKFDAAEHSIDYCIELVCIVESFNRYVATWCASVPEQWREHCAEDDAQALADKRQRAAAKAKETRERNYWNARDVLTVAA